MTRVMVFIWDKLPTGGVADKPKSKVTVVEAEIGDQAFAAASQLAREELNNGAEQVTITLLKPLSSEEQRMFAEMEKRQAA